MQCSPLLRKSKKHCSMHEQVAQSWNLEKQRIFLVGSQDQKTHWKKDLLAKDSLEKDLLGKDLLAKKPNGKDMLAKRPAGERPAGERLCW